MVVNTTIDSDGHLVEESLFVFKSSQATDPEDYPVKIEVKWPNMPNCAKVEINQNTFSILIKRKLVIQSLFTQADIYVGDEMHGPQEYPKTVIVIQINYGKVDKHTAIGIQNTTQTEATSKTKTNNSESYNEMSEIDIEIQKLKARPSPIKGDVLIEPSSRGGLDKKSKQEVQSFWTGWLELMKKKDK